MTKRKSKGKKAYIEETLILFFAEIIAAGVRGDKLRFAAGIFAAVQGTEEIDSTRTQAVFIDFQKRARIRQLTAGTATPALAPPVSINRQKTGDRPFNFSGPCVFRFNISHKYRGVE
jgi:hypothetical protein